MCYAVRRHGNAERVYRLEFVSNSGFTDNEFNKWQQTMITKGMTLPTVYDVEKKMTDIKRAITHVYKDTEIDEVGLCHEDRLTYV